VNGKNESDQRVKSRRPVDGFESLFLRAKLPQPDPAASSVANPPAEAKGETPACLLFSVRNLTSFGALLARPASGASPQLETGSTLQSAELFCSGVGGELVVGRFASIEIRHHRLGESEELLGVCFLASRDSTTNRESTPSLGTENRGNGRVRIIEGLSPQGWFAHPLQYDQKVVFDVLDLSRRGARFLTSLRNDRLFVGLELHDVQIFLPTTGLVRVQAQIAWVAPSRTAGKFEIGVEFTEVEKSVESSIASFLVGFGELPARKVRHTIGAAGLRAKFVKSEVEFGFVSGRSEYDEVLRLRLRAYSRAGKVDPDGDHAAMSDPFDLQSRIIVARHRGVIVGSVRVTVCRDPGESFELDSSIVLPKSIDRSSAAEISRLCVADDFENTDLVLGLVERAMEVAAKLRIGTAISSCVEEMLPYYRKLGFFPTGLRFELATLNSIPHFFLVHDMRSSRSARGMNLIYWNFTFRRVSEHLRKLGYLRADERPSAFKELALRVALAVLGFVQRARNTQHASLAKLRTRPGPRPLSPVVSIAAQPTSPSHPAPPGEKAPASPKAA
jgi:hypothetical protein